jgi:hypothetical protein
MTRAFADLWMHLPNSGRAVMALAISGVSGKWVFDDFRHSRVTIMTWILAAAAALALILAATAVIEPSN